MVSEILGMMEYAKPIVANMSYFTYKPPRTEVQAFTNQNLTYPIEQVRDIVFGHIRLPEPRAYTTTGRLASAVMSSIVRIDVMGNSREGGKYSRHFSTGTGFVVDGLGYVVTNRHVIYPRKPFFEWDDRPEIRLEFRYGPEGELTGRVTATVVGYDDPSDLAVLKVKLDEVVNSVKTPEGHLRELPFAYSTGVGERVVAVGFARGTKGFPTVTEGIVSAVAQCGRRASRRHDTNRRRRERRKFGWAVVEYVRPSRGRKHVDRQN